MYLHWSDLDAKDYDKIVARIFLELMKSVQRIKNYFITHTGYAFVHPYCDNYENLKIYNNDCRKSLNTVQELIGREKSTKLIESVNNILNNNL